MKAVHTSVLVTLVLASIVRIFEILPGRGFMLDNSVCIPTHELPDYGDHTSPIIFIMQEGLLMHHRKSETCREPNNIAHRKIVEYSSSPNNRKRTSSQDNMW